MDFLASVMVTAVSSGPVCPAQVPAPRLWKVVNDNSCGQEAPCLEPVVILLRIPMDTR